MAVFHIDSTPSNSFNTDIMKGVTKQVLVGSDQGWDSHVMRLFTLAEGGFSPLHEHPWPHIAFILSGKGILLIDGKESEIESGSYAFVPPGKKHQFRNAGSDNLRFICIVPTEGDV